MQLPDTGDTTPAVGSASAVPAVLLCQGEAELTQQEVRGLAMIDESLRLVKQNLDDAAGYAGFLAGLGQRAGRLGEVGLESVELAPATSGPLPQRHHRLAATSGEPMG